MSQSNFLRCHWVRELIGKAESVSHEKSRRTILNNSTSSPVGRGDQKNTPVWYWIVAGLGLAWNVFGLTAFKEFATGTKEYWQSTGMTAEQAALYSSLPTWMTVVFAIGVFGAVIGCVLLLARHRLALPVLAVSMAGYALLYVGDIVLGVFSALGTPQVAVLTTVIAVAAALLWLAIHARSRAILR
jgi:hypothetical protein